MDETKKTHFSSSSNRQSSKHLERFSNHFLYKMTAGHGNSHNFVEMVLEYIRTKNLLNPLPPREFKEYQIGKVSPHAYILLKELPCSLFQNQNTRDMELIAYTDLEDWESVFFHSPGPRGMCAIFNGPVYHAMKKTFAHDSLLNKVFRIKEQAR